MKHVKLAYVLQNVLLLFFLTLVWFIVYQIVKTENEGEEKSLNEEVINGVLNESIVINTDSNLS